MNPADLANKPKTIYLTTGTFSTGPDLVDYLEQDR
jgi:hypothetical protein